MWLDEYEKISVSTFKGLYARGSLDEVPVDHASSLLNVQFGKTAQVSTRNGTSTSIASIGTVVRAFGAAINSTIILLTCNGAGTITRQDTKTTLLSVANMIDFAAINMFDKVFIAPILSSYSSTNYCYVWDGTNAPRPMAGAAPGAGMTGAPSATAGNVPIGTHQFAVSFVTNTGYTTAPGSIVSVVSVDSVHQVALASIPTGPTGTIARQIFVTQSDLDVFYYLAVGYINDNTTTSFTVNFFDTDLAVSADALFDLAPNLLGGVGYGNFSFLKYNGRLFAINATSATDVILVSNAGSAESFDTTVGYIQMPYEGDGNQTRAGCILYNVLYLLKSVGILATQDNGGSPSTWIITVIDGGVGAPSQAAIATLSATQPSLGENGLFLIADIEGIFAFNGVILRPQLTWKIQDIWNQYIGGTLNNTMDIILYLDPFNDLIYCLNTSTGYLVVGDFSEGLDAEDIAWSVYAFSWTPKYLFLLNFNDGGDFHYWLRLAGSDGNLYKMRPQDTSDAGNAITSFWQSALLTPSTVGMLNVFRYIRARIFGTGTLVNSIAGEDNQGSINIQNFPLSATPGQDFSQQINFMNEKMLVRVGTNVANQGFTLQRLDVYAKELFKSRPNQ